MTNQIILVVEDSPTEQLILRDLLQKFDYESQIAGSGEEALAAVQANVFLAILMDIALPGIDGYECTRRIRRMESESGRRTPIIALTAQSRKTGYDMAVKAGLDDFLSKPFKPEHLRKILLRHAYSNQRPNLMVLQTDDSSDDEE